MDSPKNKEKIKNKIRKLHKIKMSRILKVKSDNLFKNYSKLNLYEEANFLNEKNNNRLSTKDTIVNFCLKMIEEVFYVDIV